jgi:DNA polymerase-3 subunit gamma/tau
MDISELAEARNDPLLAAHIRNHIRLVSMQPGLLDICLTDGAPDSLPGEMARRLSDWTEERWMVSLSDGPGGMTIAEARRAAQQREIESIAETPLMRAITGTFPGATIESVTPVTRPHMDQPHTDQPNEDNPT